MTPQEHLNYLGKLTLYCHMMFVYPPCIYDKWNTHSMCKCHLAFLEGRASYTSIVVY